MTDEIKDGEPTPTPQAINNIRTDKTWYNGLVDDNGSGNGTMWNKAAVSSSLYSVDLAFAQLDTWGQWNDLPFFAQNFVGANGGTWTVGAGSIQTNRYAVISKTLFWSVYLSWFSGSSVIAGSPTAIKMFGLPWNLRGLQTAAIDLVGGVSGVPPVAGLYATTENNGVAIAKANNAPFTASDTPGFVAVMTFEVA